MLIGLTGNFGSGKSSVLGIFKRSGAITVSSDKIVHRLLDDPEIKEAMVSALGNVLDDEGVIDKRKVSTIIFNDQNKKKSLESILHPRVMDEIRTLGNKHKNDIVIAEIPLLFEGGYDKDMDKTITVFTKKELAYKRLKKACFTESDIISRLSNQMPDSAKKKLSDFVIDNSQDLKKTEEAVKKIFKELQKEI